MKDTVSVTDSISGTWVGRYWYREGEIQIPATVPFTATFFENDIMIHGTTLEPNTFVLADYDELAATISGSRMESLVQFVKIYDEYAELEDYAVLYTGEINGACDTITGGWVIEDDYETLSGGFELHRVSAKASVARSIAIRL